MQQSTHFLGVGNQSHLCYRSQMNIKKIVVSIAFCGFSASTGSLPVPHIVVHKPKVSLVGIPAYVQSAARKSGLPPRLIKAVIHIESRGHEHIVSSAGAVGLMQLEPTTAKILGVNPWNPKENVVGGALYLAKLVKRFGNVKDALISYNEGETALMQGKIYPAADKYAVEVIRYESTES